MSICSRHEHDAHEWNERRRKPRRSGFGCQTFGTREEQAARIREAGKRARIHQLTDAIVNGVWERRLDPEAGLSPLEVEALMVELAKLTGCAEYV